jgi:hypothetical protein
MDPITQRAYEVLDRLNDPERTAADHAHAIEREQQIAAGTYREWQLPDEAQPVQAQEVPDIVYKTYDPNEPHVASASQPAQQQIPDLPPAVMARWDDWFDRRFRQCLINQFERDAFLSQIFGEALSIVRSEAREDFAKVRDEFNREIGSLRVDFTLQTAVAKGEIAQLKGKADAA